MSLFRSLFGKAAPTPVQEPQSNPDSELEQHSKPRERRVRQRVNARAHTRVLVIDDSPTIVTALAKILVSAGYATFQAFDAESGIEVARQEKPELIFLDIVLPGMNGFAALRQMRRDPLTRHIPIIMISGNEQATEQFYANRIGADDFMKKPFSRSEVFAKIEPLLDDDMIPRRRNFAPNEVPPTPPAPAPAAPVSVATPIPAPSATVVSSVTASESLPSAATVPVAQAIAAAPAQTTIATPVPAAPAPTPTPAPAQSSLFSALEARKELTAMGLQYFDQAQFIAAIQRGDKLAFELFAAGGGIDINAETDGKTPLQIARENGRTQIFALLRARIAAQKAEEEASPPTA